jgi:hypothetical protein
MRVDLVISPTDAEGATRYECAWTEDVKLKKAEFERSGHRVCVIDPSGRDANPLPRRLTPTLWSKTADGSTFGTTPR